MNDFVTIFQDGSYLINKLPPKSLRNKAKVYFQCELAFGNVPPLAVKLLLGK